MHKNFKNQIDKKEYHQETLVDILRFHAGNFPDATAFTFLENGEIESEPLSFSQLDTRAKALAVRLLQGAKAQDRALLLFPSSLDYIIAFFGCLYAGIVPIPCYPPKRNKTDQRLESIAKDAQASIALLNKKSYAYLDQYLLSTPALKNLTWIVSDNIERGLAKNWTRPDIHSSSLAFLQYTSGSTSTPKGVMVSHGNLIQVMKECDMSWNLSRESVMVTWLPIFHDLGLIFGILQPLFNGAKCYFMPPTAFLQKPLRWFQTISKHGGTHTAAPNFAYELCAERINDEERDALDLSKLNMAMNAAEPIRVDTIRHFCDFFQPSGFRPDTFCPAFGMAESTLKATASCVEEDIVQCEIFSEDLGTHRAISPEALSEGEKRQEKTSKETQIMVGSGHPLASTEIAIANPESLQKCSPNQVGEIWIKGPIVAQGYWNRPEETEEIFHAYLSDTKEGPFLRTGDLGFLRDGELYVTGRLKDVIIIRGVNHYPQDIEWTVQQAHPALRLDYGAAFPVDFKGEERLVIAQEIRRTHLKNFDPEEIFSSIRQAISESHDLQVFSIALLRTASILKTTSGKIRRRACKEAWQGENFPILASWKQNLDDDKCHSSKKFSSDSQCLSSAVIQEWIIQWMSKELHLTPGEIKASKPFSSYGMDSANAVAFSCDLEDWLHRKVDEIIVWNYPTPKELADYLSLAGKNSGISSKENLDDLSEEQLAELLLAEISGEKSS